MLSATMQGFLPDKLRPLGFSLPGQLRVPLKSCTLNHVKKKFKSLFSCFNFFKLKVVNYVDKYLLTVRVIQPPPKTLSPNLFIE